MTPAVSSGECLTRAKNALADYGRGDDLGTGSVVEEAPSIAEIERRELESIEDCSDCPQLPFGYSNERWERFKSLTLPGDCIIFFRTDDASWGAMRGLEGYALVRSSEIVSLIPTRQT